MLDLVSKIRKSTFLKTNLGDYDILVKKIVYSLKSRLENHEFVFPVYK